MTHISTNRAHPKNVMGPDSTTTPNRTGRPRIKTPRGTPVFSRGGPAGVQVILICFFLKVNAAPPPGGAALQTSTLLLLGKSLIDPTMVKSAPTKCLGAGSFSRCRFDHSLCFRNLPP